MDAKTHRWVQRHGWDRAVHHYHDHWGSQLRAAHDAVIALAALQPGESVIDVACGTGMVTMRAADAVGTRGTVLATDISGQMVAETARRAAERGLAHVAALRCDSEALVEAIGDRPPFDVAICSLGLMYVPAPDAAVAQLATVLRPGGRMVVAVWGERRNCGWASIFPVVDARVDSDVCPLFFALGAPGSLVELATRAGFVDVDERRIQTQLVYEDDTDALAAAFLGGPVALAYSRFDEPTQASASADYLASIAPFRDGAGYRIPGEFVIVAAHLPGLPGSVHESQRHQHHHQPKEAIR